MTQGVAVGVWFGPPGVASCRAGLGGSGTLSAWSSPCLRGVAWGAWQERRAEGRPQAAGELGLTLGLGFEQGQVCAYLTHVWLKPQEWTGGRARPEGCCILPGETAERPASSWRGVRAEGRGCAAVPREAKLTR